MQHKQLRGTKLSYEPEISQTYYSPKHRGSLSVIYTTDIIPDFVVCTVAHLKKLLTVTISFVDVCITRHRMQTKCELYQLNSTPRSTESRKPRESRKKNKEPG